jgi:nitronate monooxygenase
MDFATGTSKTKAWRDIWGSGQGIGAVREVQPAAEYVATLAEEYDAAKAQLRAKAGL